LLKDGAVIKRYRVLIADKNPHIRRFLKREFTRAGYAVLLADNSESLFKLIYGPSGLDLLIIDPDLPDVDLTILSQRLCDRVPPLPVILHTLDPEVNAAGFSLIPTTLVEKNGGSVEKLKMTVAGLFSASEARLLR
jgi:DNA-binding NtrC family response regulator